MEKIKPKITKEPVYLINAHKIKKLKIKFVFVNLDSIELKELVLNVKKMHILIIPGKIVFATWDSIN